MSVRLTETAFAEIREIYAYIAKDNPVAAAAVAAAIERTIAAIEKRPTLAPIVHDGKIRAKLVERFQYRIFYEVERQVVIIRNVRSTRRRRPWEN
jgi:plasmid stabilization system protein ParE